MSDKLLRNKKPTNGRIVKDKGEEEEERKELC